MLGEVAIVITAGQKVLPKKAMSLGYHFKYPELEGALRDVFKDNPKPVTTIKPEAASARAHH
jgi:NAD dependent epimerase/dehydratase family enzyme